MKKMVAFVFSTLLSISAVHAQSRSEVNSLAMLAKTWGLIKYYHPSIATGKKDWDSVLMRSIQRLRAKGKMDDEIHTLLSIAGEDTAAEYKANVREAICARNYDLSWIDRSSLLQAEQKKELWYIAKHPYHGQNYYAQDNPGNSHTVSTPNEKPYTEMLFPEVDYRLLCLFRFWNIVEYFYPYKYAIGKSWDDVLTDLIPVFVRATDTAAYHRALLKMSASLNDGHCGLWPQVYDPLLGSFNAPFNFLLIDGKAVVTKIVDSNLRENAAIEVGSVIERVDGVPLTKKIKRYWNYISASNSGGKIKGLHGLIFRSKNSQVLISGYQPDGKKFTATIPLVKRNFIQEHIDFFEMKSSVTSKLIGDSIGYVYFSNISAQNLDSVMTSLLNTKAIIVDMRNYPTGGAGTYSMPNYLLSRSTIYARVTRPDFRLPGMMLYEAANVGTPYAYVGKDNPNPYQGKVILLVDERTQSAAEWACMTLQTAPNVAVIGRRTAGADGNVTGVTLLGGYQIFFSGLGIYYPDGEETQRVGIRLDIPVDYAIGDLFSHNDPVLNRAIDYLQTNK